MIDIGQEVKFDSYKTLCVIEKDSMISEIFRDENKVEYSLLKTMATQGLINPDTEQLLKSIFEKIILERKALLQMYISVGEVPSITPSLTPSFTPSLTPSVKKEKALPRRYGKNKIEADIKKQGGKPTEEQLAGLRVNELKNIYVNLEARVIKTLLSDDKVLTEEDCRTIRATIDTVKKKLEEILKKK